MKTTRIWDVIVIGGGPAGMMAASQAAGRGKSVLLLEKNNSLGKKLLITGGGRCNLTNYKPEVAQLVASYREKPKALFSAFTQFGVEDTLDFFHSRGMETKQEAESRVFPASNSAESVWQVLVDSLQHSNVKVRSNSKVTNLSTADGLFVVTLQGQQEFCKSCIVATGGTSHPETGSTGDGFKWLKNLGHTIIDNNFALVPIALKDSWVKNISGLTLPEVKLTLIQDGKKQAARKGKLLFTHFGISGPTVLNMSSQVGELLQYGQVTIELDLLPELDYDQLRSALNETLLLESNKKIKNVLGKLVPTSLVKLLLELAEVDPEKPNHSVTKEERARLVQTMKSIPMEVKSLLGANKAIVSSGGVKIEEVNFQTMMSRIVPNLFIVGDVLNIDRPSGGYSLQLCWSTGYVAGNNC